MVLDEVQTISGLFAKLRPEIDADRRAGLFLLLGSASGTLLRQSAESLAGRIAYLELTPFLLEELDLTTSANSTTQAASLWLCGGFPRSFLAGNEAESFAWRIDFIETFLARDLPQLGITIPAETLRRFWRMCAHLHGQLFNASQLGAALGGEHTTVGRYLDLLVSALARGALYAHKHVKTPNIIQCLKALNEFLSTFSHQTTESLNFRSHQGLGVTEISESLLGTAIIEIWRQEHITTSAPINCVTK